MWIRFKNGSDLSAPVLVVCSRANAPQTDLQINGVGYLNGDLRTLDGTFVVPSEGATRVFSANSGGAPLTSFTALAGTLSYAYLGGSSQQVDGGLFDSYGDPLGGSVVFQSNRLF